MITEIPTASDFFSSGKELLDFGWGTALKQINTYNEAKEGWGVEVDEAETKEYWEACKRQLSIAQSSIQQGVEFVIKGKITEFSPFLLFANEPNSWPSPYKNSILHYCDFKTLQAQDLIRVYDTISNTRLDEFFSEKFNESRRIRNISMHSIDKRIKIQTAELIELVLYMFNELFPDEHWGRTRLHFLETSPESILHGPDWITNTICYEYETVIDLLKTAVIKKYLGINKKQRGYYCPECWTNANRDIDFECRIARLKPPARGSTLLYCPVCAKEYTVLRQECTEKDCPGNVISDEYGICLTCGR